MNLTEFLQHFDQVIEAPLGTTGADDPLSGMSAWDSVAVLSFIAMVDEKFNVTLSGKDIAACATPRALAALLGDQIS